MDADKFKDKIFLLKKICPICRNVFINICLKCFFNPIFKTGIINRCLKGESSSYIHIQRIVDIFLLLYLYQRLYRRINFLRWYRLGYKFEMIMYVLKYEEVYYDSGSISTIQLAMQRTPLENNSQKDSQEIRKDDPQVLSSKSITSIGRPGITVTASNSFSMKPKKSSNILSAFVRRNKKNKTKNSGINLKTNKSSQNLEYIASNSSLGIHTEEEVEVNVLNYEKNFDRAENVDEDRLTVKEPDEHLNSTDSEHSIPSTKMKTNFFRKLIMRRNPPSEVGKRKSEHALAIQSTKINTLQSTKRCKFSQSESCHDMSRTGNTHKKTYVATSYVNFGKSTLNVTLANGLQSVQELGRRFYESENHLIQLLNRYLKDPGLQKDLMEALSQHSKMQWEAERKTSALANDMWMHQIEIGRAQERTLQETLNSLVRQNRQLQIDNEVMFRKHERLVRKLRNFPEMSLKYKCMDCDTQIEHIVKHNEKLQYKLETYIQQIEHLENELHILKKQNDVLEQQLRLSSSQVHNLKDSIQRSKTDHELEIVTLNYKLQTKEQNINEGLEAGDILLEDVECLKRQFKSIPFAINWSKFKCRGSCLSDLIHISRTCINDLSKEIISLHTQISFKERDIETLQDTNSRLQENLKKSTTELDNLSKKLDETSMNEAEKVISEQKCKLLESDLKVVHEQMEKIKLKYDLEKTSLLHTISDYENLNNEISDKDKFIEQTKVFISNITSENLALRNEVEGLNKIMSECGAGDVVKELATYQEQVAYFQSQYYQLQGEKQHLIEHIEMLKLENKAVLDRQESNYNNLQQQLLDLEKISKENNLLRQQYDSEHQTVLFMAGETFISKRNKAEDVTVRERKPRQRLSQKKYVSYEEQRHRNWCTLQTERMKYLEEKNVLKTIFQHMKLEIARVQKLESAVTDITKEASKLAMIAEYNKKLGEKLKSEVIEKDQTILKLRSSVDKLNDIQIQNTKEKLSLCYELSEVCQMKEQLNNVLAIEVQKNVALGDSKKEFVETASSQLKKYEEMQKNERSTLKDLVKEYRTVVKQKDSLLKEKENLLQEISELKMNYQEQVKVSVGAKNEKDEKIAELTAKQEEDKFRILSLQEKLNSEIIKYEENFKQLDKLIRQLRKEREELDNSVKYLQNNIKKLHNDLNDSRQNEKESKDLLNKCLEEKSALEREKEQLQRSSTELMEEKDKLTNEVNYLNSICEKVLSDFEASIKASVEKEEIYKKEVNESKAILVENSRELDHITETLYLRQGELQKIHSDYRELRQKDIEIIKSYETQNEELKDLRNRRQDLENEVYNLRIAYDSLKLHFDSVQNELQYVQKQLTVVLNQKEEDYKFQKQQIDDLSRKNEVLQERSNRELGDLTMKLTDITHKLDSERASYATLSEIHKEVSAKFLRSVKDVVDEKNARKEVEAKLKEVMKSYEKFNTEKADLQHQINILLDGLNEGKNRINTLTQEKDNNQNSLDDLQRRYSDLLAKCLALENELRAADLKVTSSGSDYITLREQLDRFKQDALENHELICTLNENVTKLQQQIAGLEFQKSEMTLRLHETQRRYETEQSLCEQLKNTHKLVLAAVLKMKDDGIVQSSDCNHLLCMVQSREGITEGHDD